MDLPFNADRAWHAGKARAPATWPLRLDVGHFLLDGTQISLADDDAFELSDVRPSMTVREVAAPPFMPRSALSTMPEAGYHQHAALHTPPSAHHTATCEGGANI